jgi:hypothetical protein
MVIFDKRKDKGADGRAGKEGQWSAGQSAAQLRMIGMGGRGTTRTLFRFYASYVILFIPTH